MKNTFYFLFALITTLLVVDLVAFQFKTDLRGIFPAYGKPFDKISRGYPRFHHIPDKKLGFDINPNFRTSTFSKPAEYGEYAVWGNSSGCFDDEWSDGDIEGGIYLAGDSFTWGYTRYEKKFGTLLDKKIQHPVYACGVSHTGQMHQYHKFLLLYDNGIKPAIVIVNVMDNDIDNDFFFPHTTVIDGFMIENVETCGTHGSDDFSFSRIETNYLASDLKDRKDDFSIKSFLRVYSLSANVIAGVTRMLRRTLDTKIRNERACRRSVYAGLDQIGDGYQFDDASINNRGAIKSWVEHAKQHNYELIFSFIFPKTSTHGVTYRNIKEHIEGVGGKYVDFEDYVSAQGIVKMDLFFEISTHWNEYGNKVYSDYLYKVLQSGGN